MSKSIQLEEHPDRVTEWRSANHTYRFTNVAPDEWDVHRAHDIDYAAHLRRSGQFYDFEVEEGIPATTGSSLSLGDLEKLLSDSEVGPAGIEPTTSTV
jgi:hypothetical protein